MNHFEYNIALLEKLFMADKQKSQIILDCIIPLENIIQLTALEIQMNGNVQYVQGDDEEIEDDSQINMNFQSTPSQWGQSEV